MPVRPLAATLERPLRADPAEWLTLVSEAVLILEVQLERPLVAVLARLAAMLETMCLVM